MLSLLDTLVAAMLSPLTQLTTVLASLARNITLMSFAANTHQRGGLTNLGQWSLIGNFSQIFPFFIFEGSPYLTYLFGNIGAKDLIYSI